MGQVLESEQFLCKVPPPRKVIPPSASTKAIAFSVGNSFFFTRKIFSHHEKIAPSIVSAGSVCMGSAEPSVSVR